MRSMLAALLLFASLPLFADDAKPTLPLATIDVGQIFKAYKPVTEKMAPLRTAMEELKKTIDLRQVEIDQLLRKLQSAAEADDRGKLQGQIGKLQNELRVFIETERQSLQKRELQIQAEVYKEIQAVVQKLAKERGLKLVVVRPRGSLESQDAGELNRTLNQLVIYEDEALDITNDVLKALEEKQGEDK